MKLIKKIRYIIMNLQNYFDYTIIYSNWWLAIKFCKVSFATINEPGFKTYKHPPFYPLPESKLFVKIWGDEMAVTKHTFEPAGKSLETFYNADICYDYGTLKLEPS